MSGGVDNGDPRFVRHHATTNAHPVLEQSQSGQFLAALVPDKFFEKIPEIPDTRPSFGQPFTSDGMIRPIALGGQPSNSSYYYTTISGPEGPPLPRALGYLQEGDEYARLLQSQQLWPVHPLLEQNWSGRGQHAEFKKHEQKLIDELLEVRDNLGTTRTAFVQSVKCRRFLLARKTIICGKQTMTKQEAITEVAHLTRLDHAHILRVIGTYVKGRELSILLYPVANCNLERFLERYRQTSTSDFSGRETFLKNCFPCLSSAVRYIHRKLTKHMDIKPQNILVLRKSYATRTLFIADFGIARSYATLEDVETDGKTSFTKRYAAPEVIKQELRGLPADMFSLGCVFIEVYDALYGREVWYQRGSGLQACLDAGFQGDTSYQLNIEAIQADLSKFTKKYWDYVPSPSLMVEMLRHNPAERPTAEQLVATLGERSCCRGGSIALRPVGKEPHEMDIDDI